MEEKLEELFKLFDNNQDMQNINIIKNKITNQEKELIMNYRNDQSILNKKRLYENEIIKKYLISENNLNYLIMEINKKFGRSKLCQR